MYVVYIVIWHYCLISFSSSRSFNDTPFQHKVQPHVNGSKKPYVISNENFEESQVLLNDSILPPV